MREIQLTDQLTDEATEALAGTFIDERHYDFCARETCRVLKPNGEPLLIYLKDAIPRGLCEVAFATFKLVESGGGHNRGLAAGELTPDSDYVGREPGEIRGTRYRPVLQDGTLSKTSYAAAVNSAITGYFDRYPRIPYCRLTAFNLDHHAEFEAARPFLVAASRLFEEHLPNRWAAQHDVHAHTSPDFAIHDTVFTTVTVNRSWRTAVHQDAGDYKPGFGVMSVLEGGAYQGCELIFPKYRTAVDMRTGGLCLADVHEFHGNAPLVGTAGQFVRISLVMYYREKMLECGSAQEERERAAKIGDRVSDQHRHDILNSGRLF